ncbi:MAG: proprotein convertase P-domain-containing protein [Planctomycetota bacterium]|nr:MAG: proprotein convertase P-domain-containing protein [Planctomycetota bacterium]
MYTRNSCAAFVAILIVASLSSLARAAPVRIYRADFNSPIPSPDDPESPYGRGWMTDAIIDVPDHFTVRDLDVGINVTHTSAFDLQIFLQSPAGTNLCLNMYNFDEFFEGADYADTVFDDEALTAIEHGLPPFNGRFKPRAPNLLDAFDGEDTFGQWRLRIYDAYIYDTGQLKNFKLFITIPEPTSLSLFILAAGLITLRKPRTGS